MRIQNMLGVGIIMSFLIIFTGCPMECVAPHTIEQNITILPQTDTIHLGDTLKFTTSFDAVYTENGINVDITEKEINFLCYINSYNQANGNPFFSDFNSVGIENFEFILKKGIIKNSEILNDEEGANREFIYELSNGKLEAEFEIVAKDTGNYIMKLLSRYENDFSHKNCEENFELIYYFEISDGHKLNDYLLRDTTGIDKNSFYAFVVVE